MYLVVVGLRPLITQSTLVKFGGGAKPVQKVTSCTGLPLELYNKYYELPFDVSPEFIGGHEVCRNLRDSCLPSGNSTAQISQRIFTLYGLGGSGKTQMALKFASDHRERYIKSFCERRNLGDFADP